MVIAKNKYVEIRLGVVYRQLNKQVISERVIMPTVDLNLAKLANAKLCNKLGTNAGYWQTPLEPESQVQTTSITPLWDHQYLQLPCGIVMAPEVFQRQERLMWEELL